jgi:hypothetical protein
MSNYQLQNGTWANVDSMILAYNNRVSASLTSIIDEELAIVSGTPESPTGASISITDGTVPVNAVYGDDLHIDAGVADQELSCVFTFPVSASTPNVIITGQVRVDGVTKAQKIITKLSSAGDTDTLTFTAVVPVSAMSTIGFYFDADSDTTLTIKQGSSWNLKTFEIS